MKISSLKNEKIVLKELKDGDVEAFNLVYEHYKDVLTGNILRFVKSEEVAVDLVQELFIKVWLSHEKIDLDKPFRAYLFTIAQNLVTDLFRKTKRSGLLMEKMILSSTELYSHVEEDVIQKEAYQSLYASISKLPKQCQRVFVMHKIEEKTYQEIRAELGISDNTIKEHIMRATKALKEDLNPDALSVALFVSALLHNL